MNQVGLGGRGRSISRKVRQARGVRQASYVRRLSLGSPRTNQMVVNQVVQEYSLQSRMRRNLVTRSEVIPSKQLETKLQDGHQERLGRGNDHLVVII